MDLQEATMLELIEELQNRQVEFVFIAHEDSNTNRDKAAWFSMKGKDKSSIQKLARAAGVLSSGWKAPSLPEHETGMDEG